ncbi:MAG TPA: hypothetical protein VKR32_06055 [Puia sp.]|nr:hypothetical protein [Puia sp.]
MLRTCPRFPFFLLLLSAGVASCSKNHSDEVNAAESGCIERIVARPTDLPLNGPPIINVDPITPAQIDTIETLFAKNNMSYSNLEFIFYNNSIGVQATATPFLNGLPIFNDGQVYDFVNGIYSSSDSYLTTEVSTDNNTTSNQSLANLRTAFFDHLSEATITGPQLNAKPSVPLASSYLDTCLSATLGYLDLSYIPGNPFSLGHVVKVWEVSPVNGYYPTVYVRDDNGHAWGVPIYIP